MKVELYSAALDCSPVRDTIKCLGLYGVDMVDKTTCTICDEPLEPDEEWALINYEDGGDGDYAHAGCA